MAAKKDLAGELADKMIRSLERHRALGGSAYPLTTRRLAELADPQATPAQVGKAINKRTFQSRAALADRKDLDAPVALYEDIDLLAGGQLLLDFLFRKARTPANQAFSVAQLKAKATTKLQKAIQLALARQIERGSLPPGIGWITISRSRKLFLLSDIQTGRGMAVPAAVQEQSFQPTDPSPTPAQDSLALAFDEAFTRLDREAGRHNLVSLVFLRRALTLKREVLDGLLNDLRRAGRYSLSAAEGRHGIGPEEQAAGIEEGGSLLLYVSRREIG
jgi:hypothetical protein